MRVGAVGGSKNLRPLAFTHKTTVTPLPPYFSRSYIDSGLWD